MADLKEEKENKVERGLTTNVHQGGSLTAINLFDEKQLAAAEVFLTKIMRSDKGGIKSINDGLAILMRAQDLNLPFSSCIEHIHVVSGKTVIDVHIIKAMLSKAGVVWDKVKDYTPLYQYTDGNIAYNEDSLPSYCVKCKTPKEAAEITSASGGDEVGIYPVRYYQDYHGNIYNEFQINQNFAIAVNKQHAGEIAKQNKIPIIRIPSQPIDWIVEYKFQRARMLGNVIKVQESISHFSYKEAQLAGFFEKDAYKKYARIMIDHRAFTYGARDIASDVLMGCQELLEWKLQDNVPITDNDVIETTAEVVED